MIDFDKYRTIVGIGNDKEKLKFALIRAHDLRRFEIENYWRRSTYFWGFQLASFAALAVVRQSGDLDPTILMVIAIIGTITAQTGVITAKGSKFWQRNWESHVDALEDAIEGRLHKTVFVRSDGFQPSVSQANERLLRVLMIGWIMAFLYGLYLTSNFAMDRAIDWAIVGRITVAIIGGVGAFIYMHRTPKSALLDRARNWPDLRKYGS